ncbi:hypothetical protein EB796_003922 [Bugula neritina]|uniref:Acyltransferase 3 domain-containing protein n=1 Tax=Bugula neritina TaxID=10212 RepID=A0A7J7KKA2_BUGNE|nr:hypothetical protein EB796_003922 [Bugula neritina]
MTLYKRFASEVIMNATVSVDTFFVLSGLLVSYLFLKDFHKRKARLVDFAKGLPLMYLHRYLRLTPAYGFLILIYTSLLWFVSDGPFWPNYPTPPYQTFDQNCVNNWYLNILYVNNIFKVSKQCAAWGWYLGNDMQFFLVAPFIVYLMYRYKKIGVAFCIATILGSIVAALVVSGEQHVTFAISPLAHNNVTTVEDIKLPYYDVPWTRYQTYGIGLLAGFLIFELRKRSYKIPTLLNLALWGVSAALCMSVVYGPFSANMGYHVVYLPEDIFYSGLARSAWALGISFVMISCSLNQGGWVNEFLSWKGFVPLSRMTYCAYLVHIPGLLVIFNTARHGILFTDIQLTLTLILCLTVAFLLAFVFSLIFEMPFINLDKLFLAPLSLKKGRDEVVVKPVEEPPPRYVEREAAGYTPLPS